MPHSGFIDQHGVSLEKVFVPICIGVKSSRGQGVKSFTFSN